MTTPTKEGHTIGLIGVRYEWLPVLEQLYTVMDLSHIPGSVVWHLQ